MNWDLPQSVAPQLGVTQSVVDKSQGAAPPSLPQTGGPLPPYQPPTGGPLPPALPQTGGPLPPAQPWQPSSNTVLTPADIARMRAEAFVPQYSSQSVALARGPQFVRDVWAKGLQGRTGTPFDAWLEELRRLRPRGYGGRSVGIGY